MMITKKLIAPLGDKDLEGLRAGDMVLLSGTVYAARDLAHKRIIQSIQNGQKPPISLEGSTIFYAGPAPVPPGKKSGSVGPTTAVRMDSMTEPLLKLGLKATIGKGARSRELRDLLVKYKAVYFVSPGGTAAYLASRIKSIRQVAYQDLGAEAIYMLDLDDFPLFTAYDIYGQDIFEQALRKE